MVFAEIIEELTLANPGLVTSPASRSKSQFWQVKASFPASSVVGAFKFRPPEKSRNSKSGSVGVWPKM